MYIWKIQNVIRNKTLLNETHYHILYKRVKKKGILIEDVVVKTIKLNPIANAVSWFAIGNIRNCKNWFGCTHKHKIWGNK